MRFEQRRDGTFGWYLDVDECKLAAAKGAERHILAHVNGRAKAYGNKDEDSWTTDIEAMAAEMVVCAFRGVEFNPVVGELDTELGDAGDGHQVRHTRSHGNRLILHDKDSDDDYFWLVTGPLKPDVPERPAPLLLHGACLGSIGKRKEFWSDPGTGRPAYFVDRSALIPPLQVPQVT